MLRRLCPRYRAGHFAVSCLKQGLRPIQIWVPDVRRPGFRKEAHRQSVAVAESASAQADQDFIDAISELDGS